MNQLLINGCYDEKTLRSFLDLGVTRFAFDLRSKSPNLVPFNQLKIFAEILAGKEIVLIFENDRTATILSFLDMLKSSPVKCVLEFRDFREADYYKSLQHPFLWMFEPGSDWANILQVPFLKGVLLPILMKDRFQEMPMLWSIIEERKLDVYLHAESFAEAEIYISEKDLLLSIDVTKEVEVSYRNIDQKRLRDMRIWRKLNEITSI